MNSSWQLHCPVPIDGRTEVVTLAYGEGARQTRRFIEEHIRRRFDNPLLSPLSDAATLVPDSKRLAITTDGFVVSPLFFPGGDIGSLAVHGTVNDLAVAGARPRWITLSMILEEGLPLAVLDRVLDSVARAAIASGVIVVAGDTKVVPRGAADGMFLTTTGVGELVEPVPPGPASILEGDVVIVSGPIGCHGVAVLNAREELAFEPPPETDSASLIDVVGLLRDAAGNDVRAIRDATRGGVSAVLHEWASVCRHTFRLRERDVVVTAVVRGACELLGLDPLHVACEGTLVAVVAADSAAAAVDALRRHPVSAGAAAIGHAVRKTLAPVTVVRTLGPEQPLDEPAGSPLPRIC